MAGFLNSFCVENKYPPPANPTVCPCVQVLSPKNDVCENKKPIRQTEKNVNLIIIEKQD